MRRAKKSHLLRRRTRKNRHPVCRRKTNQIDIQPQIPASMDNIPEFLIQAKNAVEAGNKEQAKALLAEEAVQQIHKMQQGPSKQLAMYVLASQLRKIRDFERAWKWYKKILEYGQYAFAYHDLGFICHERGELIESVEYRSKALKLEPDDPLFLHALGLELLAISEVDKGVELLRKAVEKEQNDMEIDTWLLVGMHFKPDITPQILFDEHKKWADRHTPIAMARTNHHNNPAPDKKLRVGYISPNFRKHSVMYFFEPLLDGHDRRNVVEIYGYSNSKTSDEFTERMKPKFDMFRGIYQVCDDTVAEMIEQDKIDILVDLAGHTKGNRLLVLAKKPAPIQVTYLGYPDTTGMEQVDYRITDDLADPPQLHEFYSEKQVCLPDGFLCYRPPDVVPPLAASPHIKNGYITFGTFNINTKVNPLLIALWAQVLKANENSRLLLKFIGGDNQQVQNHYRSQFEQLGIDPNRIELHGRKSLFEHLAMYGKMDISLDTYPYHGTTTTCEALWMGVPVISLIGKQHSCRVGLTLLKRLDMDFFAASTPEEYVAKATALAHKPEALAKIRASMRARMAASPLCDPIRFAGNMEQAYRQMWHKWCKSQGVNIPGKNLETDVQLSSIDASVCSSNRT